MRSVRLGIIGIGNMGTSHLKKIEAGEVPGLYVSAIADREENRRNWCRKQYGEKIHIFESGIELMISGECDAVLIAVPHYQHPELTIAALERGLHVLCEKPAGVYTKQVREMNETAQKSDKVFAMMFNQRTNPVYKKIHAMVKSGELGEIRRINWIVTDWYRTQNYYDSGIWRATWDGEGGGVLLNQCPHNMDLLQWICGMPKKIQAFCHNGKWHDIEVEDDVTAYMEYENGATGVFITSTGDAPGTNRFEITGTLGKLVCEEGKIHFWRLSENIVEHCNTCKAGFVKPEYRLEEINVAGVNEEHVGVMKAFVGKILGDNELVAGGEEGINGLMISNAMHLSSWLKQPLTLPIDEELFYSELKNRRATSRKKEGVGVVFDTDGSY